MHVRVRLTLALAAVAAAIALPCFAQEETEPQPGHTARPVIIGRQYAVSSMKHQATEAAVRILEAGGNAFDAAVAGQAVLALVDPASNSYGSDAVVLVYDAKFNLVASSNRITNTSWSTSLARGQVYSWQVKAIKDNQEIISPRPPAPQARFRVLDQNRANELAKAKRAYGSSHLTLAVLYADAGLLKEAEQELRLLRRANPDSDLASKLLRQVQALRK